MKTKPIRFSIRIFSMVLIFSGGLLNCAASTDIQNLDPRNANESFIPRPRFEKPVPRPLNRIFLFWENVPKAESYEVQSSATQDFRQVIKTWSVITPGVEVLRNQDNETLVTWYRVRALGKDSASQWSALIQVGGVL